MEDNFNKFFKILIPITIVLILIISLSQYTKKWVQESTNTQAESRRLRQESEYKKDKESGLWIPGQQNQVAEHRKKPSESKNLTPDGNIATHRLNCGDFPGYPLTRLKPEESIQIRHVIQEEHVRMNRCSFSITGASYPIHAPGVQTLPKYQNAVPFRDVPAHGMIVYLAESYEDQTVFLPPGAYNSFPHKWIQSEGGVVVLTNNTGKEMWALALYNYGKQPQEFSQTGYDGSTVTLETVKYFASHGEVRAKKIN